MKQEEGAFNVEFYDPIVALSGGIDGFIPAVNQRANHWRRYRLSGVPEVADVTKAKLFLYVYCTYLCIFIPQS